MIWKRKETSKLVILDLLRFSFSWFVAKLCAFEKNFKTEDLLFCFFQGFLKLMGLFFVFSSGFAIMDPFSSADFYNSVKSLYVTKPGIGWGLLWVYFNYGLSCCFVFLQCNEPLPFWPRVKSLSPNKKKINLFIVKKLFMRHRRQLIFSIMHDLTGTFSIKGWSSLRSYKKKKIFRPLNIINVDENRNTDFGSLWSWELSST